MRLIVAGTPYGVGTKSKISFMRPYFVGVAHTHEKQRFSTSDLGRGELKKLRSFYDDGRIFQRAYIDSER